MSLSHINWHFISKLVDFLITIFLWNKNFACQSFCQHAADRRGLQIFQKSMTHVICSFLGNSLMPGKYPKRNKLHLEHGESLKTRIYDPPQNFSSILRTLKHWAPLYKIQLLGNLLSRICAHLACGMHASGSSLPSQCNKNATCLSQQCTGNLMWVSHLRRY